MNWDGLRVEYQKLKGLFRKTARADRVWPVDRPRGAWGLAGPRRGLWTGARRVHGGPGKARGRRGSGPRWTGRAGAEPRSMVDRARAGHAPAAGRTRRRHWRRAGARRGGDAGHEKSRRGLGRARLDATNATGGSPPRVDDDEEKADAGELRKAAALGIRRVGG